MTTLRIGPVLVLVMWLTGPLPPTEGPTAQDALNLVRDGPGEKARVSVDSTFAGYRPEVLIDGCWIAEGQETVTQWDHPDRLGNGGNTWVSAEALGDHWIRLDWPQAVRLNAIEIVWSQREWRPKAIRIERLVHDQWVAVDSAHAAWEPTDRRCLIATPVVKVTALRILQPRGCSGTRELLAAQEVAAYLRDGEAARSQGVFTLNEQQLSRLAPKTPPTNMARLHDATPGASLAVSYRRDGARTPSPWLADGDPQHALPLPDGTVAVGVEWPIRHVVDQVSLTGTDATPFADSLVLEMFDQRTWTPVGRGLTAASGSDRRQVTWSFAPVATRALRVRWDPSVDWSPTEIEVQPYWPADKSTWPDRLVQRSILQSEILAGEADPSFERLAAVALSMTPARAFVGTKDGQRETGVTWDGTIVGRETVSFRIGPSRFRLTEFRETLERSLLDGWRPAVLTMARLGESLRVCQTVFSTAVGSDPERAAAFIRLQLENLSDQPLQCPVRVDLRSQRAGELLRVDDTLRRGDDVVLICQFPAGVAPTSDKREMLIDLTIPARGEAAVEFVHPHADCSTDGELDAYRATTFDQALAQFRSDWDALLRDAVKVVLPESRIERMHRAVLAQLLINADGDIMPYGAAPSVYEGALFGIEESYAMLALAQWGLAADAQRYLDATYLTPEFLRKVDTYRDYQDRHQQYRNGLEPHYAVAAYRLSRDRPWIEKHLPLLRECAEWTIAQRQRTMESQASPQPLHAGLLPKWSYGGDIAEVECYALFANFACWRGLVDTAWLLEELGDAPTALRYHTEAAAYRRDIERAMNGSYQQAATPPFLPLRLYADQPDEQMDYYQLFAGCMLDVELLGPGDPPYHWITDFLEADNRVFCGLPRFRRDAGAGGLDGLYGKGYLLGKLREGAVREFLLGFYAYLAFNLDHDTFTSRETNVLYASDLHLRSTYPVPDASDPLPCSSAVALHFLRHMLATELSHDAGEPDTLLLLPGVPRHWLADGSAIRFERLPTAFGPTSVSVQSAAASGQIFVDLIAPKREPPHALKLLLRHPDSRPIESVELNGEAWARFDSTGETVDLPISEASLRLVVTY
ncbi:MAG: hypothetical protein AB1486_21755 [Planctomycetota bacterium]